MASTDTVRSTFGIHSHITEKAFTAGVELEIEDVRGFRKDPPPLFTIETDGSLRNNGKEFISHPANVETLVKGFKDLHAVLNHSAKPQPFSDRTSIHVHVNCLDLEIGQARSIILWYALFEPVFFALVEQSRRNNIHCVGLDQTVLSRVYRRTLPHFTQAWSKYTALNVKPLTELGTIEFRHMEGHADATRFEDWLKILKALWTHGQKVPFSKDEIATDDAILRNFDAIFAGSLAMKYRPYVKNMTANTLMDVKLSFI